MSIFLRTNVFFFSLFLSFRYFTPRVQATHFRLFRSEQSLRFLLTGTCFSPIFFVRSSLMATTTERRIILFSLCAHRGGVVSLQRASSTADWILSSLVVIIIITFPSESDFGDTQPKTRTRRRGFFFFWKDRKSNLHRRRQHTHTRRANAQLIEHYRL